MSEPETQYHVPEAQHPARTVLASGSAERFDDVYPPGQTERIEQLSEALRETAMRRESNSIAWAEATSAYTKEQLESLGKELQEIGRSPIPDLRRRQNDADNFGAYVHFARAQWVADGNQEPQYLYLGIRERGAMYDATRDLAMVRDPTLDGKTRYCGLEVVRVDEPSFFRVG
jgi:hypothetical protein